MEPVTPLGPLLGRCAHLARERMDARLADCDVTPAQTHVLMYLMRSGGQAPLPPTGSWTGWWNGDWWSAPSAGRTPGGVW